MKIITSCAEMKTHSSSIQKNGAAIALVPTMGALHDGHLSLLKIAKQHGCYTVMSIFVNPTQFGPSEDYDKYPRQLEKDIELAGTVGCDCLFVPLGHDMYPENYNTYVDVEDITDTLCGANRPGHFRGVATVVLKLFNIVSPDTAIFGAKDAQQVIVIKRMAEDLNLSVRIIAAPIIREADGMAMSSRNAYLSSKERTEAALIYKGLTEAQKSYDAGERSGQTIKNRIVSILNKGCLLKQEYVEVVDTVQLKPLYNIDRPSLIAIACRTTETGTRLIDNIILGGNL
jgi:pantoate--beta-alanine ligase